MGLPAGIYFLVQGIAVWGAILVLCALAVLVLALDGRILRALENRHIPRGNAMFMVIGWANSALIIIVYLFSSIPNYKGSIILIVFYAIVTVTLLALCARSLLTSKYIPS